MIHRSTKDIISVVFGIYVVLQLACFPVIRGCRSNICHNDLEKYLECHEVHNPTFSRVGRNRTTTQIFLKGIRYRR